MVKNHKAANKSAVLTFNDVKFMYMYIAEIRKHFINFFNLFQKLSQFNKNDS